MPSSSTSTPKSSQPASDYTGACLQPRGFPGLPPGWKSEWETFPSEDGKVQLFQVTHRREPWQGSRALLLVHGFGEHGGRYLHVPHYLKDVVDSVTCLDLRGHGRSEGARGHVERFDAFTDDVAAAVRRLKSRLHDRLGRPPELHLLGHSLGGHVILRVLFRHPDIGEAVSSAQATAPYLELKNPPPLSKRLGARILMLAWDALQIPANVDLSTLSHDPAVAEAYAADRLMHGKITPRLYHEIEAAADDTLARSTGIRVPLQILVPLADGLVDPEPALAFFRALKHRDKKLRTYPGLFHELMNEAEKETVFADIASWIAAHSAAGIAAHPRDPGP